LWSRKTPRRPGPSSRSPPPARTCAANSGWRQVTAAITAGRSYTLTLTSKDDNRPRNATRTEYDDVATS